MSHDHFHYPSHDQSDGFDRISDDLILSIFNKLSNIKSLARCRSVSKRFNSLVPHTEDLLVKVDCVITPEQTELTLSQVFKTLLQSLQDFIISPKRITSIDSQTPHSPSEILRGFERIKRLEIELPSGDLRLEKGTVLKWKAEFGHSLKSCIILAVRSIKMDGEDNNEGIHLEDIDGGMKLRVVWTISALIAASARHYLLREVIKEHKEIESLVLRDREGEGTVVMDNQSLREFREGVDVEDGEAHLSTVGGVGWKNRTTLPAVRMRMRHASKIDLPGGVRITGATLVIVRPSGDKDGHKNETEWLGEDRCIADGVFEGILGEAVGALFKKRSYFLEMNSF